MEPRTQVGLLVALSTTIAACMEDDGVGPSRTAAITADPVVTAMAPAGDWLEATDDDPTPPADENVCTDSDRGRDYFVRGIVAGTTISWADDDRRAFDDACVDFSIGEYGAVVEQCADDSCSIFETYCSDGVIMYEYVPCPAVCRDGACRD